MDVQVQKCKNHINQHLNILHSVDFSYQLEIRGILIMDESTHTQNMQCLTYDKSTFNSGFYFYLKKKKCF